MFSSIVRRVTSPFARKTFVKNRKCMHRLATYCVQQRWCTTEAFPPAQSEAEPKEFSPKIRKIVDDISQLTLLEVSDLNDLLKKTLNIQDTPMMAMGSMAAAPAMKEEEEQEETPKEEKTSFTVQLVKFDEKKKVALIKELKAQIEGMNLVQAKKFVESAPAVVKADMAKDEAEKLKTVLTEAGGVLEIN